MKTRSSYITITTLLLITICAISCKDSDISFQQNEDAGVLRFSTINFDYPSEDPQTRLSELNASGINGNDVDTFKHIGVYVFYRSDYDKRDYSQPYVKNVEYKYESNTIVPVHDSGENVYIYDEMVVVAFYPYNAKYNSEPLTNFDLYPVTKSEYKEQMYMPYRAITNINPSSAYNTVLNLYPQHTVKFEIVIVGSKTDYADLGNKDSIKIVPMIDPTDAPDGEDRRKQYVDNIVDYDNSDDTGRYTRKYSAYVWKNTKDFEDKVHSNNNIKKGDIIFESEKLILTAIEDITLAGGYGYRYGYNMETGEYFVLSSSSIVNCASRIHSGGFQVCDINLTDFNWVPKTFGAWFYDGGGHKIYGLNITKDFTAQPDNVNYVGLFTKMTEWSTLVNMCLESPIIDVTTADNATKPTYVGAFVGYGMQSDSLTTLHRRLSIRGCKVNNPTITVKGSNIYAGGFAGRFGHTANRDYLRDSYVLGGSITANILPNDSIAPDTINASCFIGGMVGANMGNITNCYSSALVESTRRDSTWTFTIRLDTIVIENDWGQLEEYYYYRKDTIVDWFDTNIAYGFGSNRLNHCRTKAPGEASGCFALDDIVGDVNNNDLKEKESAIGTQFKQGNGNTLWGVYSGIWPVNYTKLGSSYWRTNSYNPEMGIYPTLAWD